MNSKERAYEMASGKPEESPPPEDAEIDALIKISRVLTHLDQRQCLRILIWALDRYVGPVKVERVP